MSFGAEDHRSQTVPIAQALAHDGWSVLAVVGSGVRYRLRLMRTLAVMGNGVEAIDGRKGLLPVLRRAGWAVLAPSQSMWEALRLGLPVVVVETAANQAAGRRWARSAGVVIDAGIAGSATPRSVARALCRLRADPARVRRLRRRAALAVDGRGAARIARAILSSAGVRA